MKFLFVANCLVWLGICGYLYVLTRYQNRISIRLRQMEIFENDQDNQP